MSRIVRAGLAAGLIAVSLGSTSASAACDVRLERRMVGGTTWTAVVLFPVLACD
ncbi:MAG TPA: hypothetical protein VGX28_13365 [Frankiaceae bacterium]|jgi:hypothetical protein|nr:hypothetical protein [Frankiaceae bacterium]